MATSNLLGISPQSLVSGAAVGINRLVVVSAANTCIVTAAITDHAIGVALNAATAAGELVAVQTFGIAKCIASDVIAVGADVMPTGSGAGKVVTAAGATAVAIGVAMSASGADGDVIEVLLAAPGVDRPAVA